MLWLMSYIVWNSTIFSRPNKEVRFIGLVFVPSVIYIILHISLFVNTFFVIPINFFRIYKYLQYYN